MPYRAQVKRAVLGGSQTLAGLLASLKAAGALAIWDAGAGVYSDAGITPIANGGAVQQLNDQSGTGLHVSQGTAANKFTYRASVAAFNNRPALENDGGDFMTRAVSGGIAAAAGNDYCIVAVVANTTAEQEYCYSEGKSDSATPSIRLGKNVADAFAVHRADDSSNISIAAGGGVNDGAMHVIGLRRIASNSWSVMRDGTQIGTSANAPTTTTITHIALGGLYANGAVTLQWGESGTPAYIAHVSIYPTDVYAAVQPILDAWYRPA